MKNSIQILYTVLFSSCLIFLSSCEKEESGCTDATACNFDSSATEDDNSCIYPNECDSCEDILHVLGVLTQLLVTTMNQQQWTMDLVKFQLMIF